MREQRHQQRQQTQQQDPISGPSVEPTIIIPKEPILEAMDLVWSYGTRIQQDDE